VSPTCFAAFTSGSRLDARQGKFSLAGRLVNVKRPRYA
jgi:hypothetical protein